MLIDVKEEIVKKKDNIKKIEKDMDLIYEDLAQSVASFSKEKDFTWCEELLSSYNLSNDEYIKLKERQTQLNNQVEFLESLNKKIKNVDKKLLVLKKTLDSMLYRFGAIAFESFSSTSNRESDVYKLLMPHFEESQNLMDNLQQKQLKSKNILIKKLISLKISKNRKNLKDVFYNAALELEKKDMLNDIFTSVNNKLYEEYLSVKKQQKKLTLKRKNYLNTIKQIEEDKKEGLDSKIQELNKEIKIAEEHTQSAAILLGKGLYEELPNQISSAQVGETSIELIDQITLHKRSLDKVNNDIKLLENELKMEEIRAQINYDKTNIDHLEKQIESCEKKIEAIELNIEKKQQQIAKLKAEGSYTLDE